MTVETAGTSGEPVTIPAAVRRAVRDFGSRQAVVDGERSFTFAELGASIDRAAAALLASGVGPGDRVSIWAPNSYEWECAALAVGSIGASLVPVNTRFKGAEAADILGRTRASVLFVANGFLGNDYVDMLRRAAPGQASATGDAPLPGLPHLRHIVDFQSSGSASWEQFLERGREIPLSDVRAAGERVEPDDVLDILFTSGTTGRPKGAMSSHRQTISVAVAWADRAEVTSDDRYLIMNPYFHSFGYKAGFVVCLLRGCVAIPQQVFDAEHIARIVARERVTVLPGPPTLYFSFLGGGRDNHDLSSLRVAVTGATVVPVALIESMQRELALPAVLTAYGLTEAVVVTMCKPGDDPETIATTSGEAVAGFEIKVVDRSGQELPTGSPGEILLCGPNVMLGYFEDPAATAAAIDPDGWLHTGDVGFLNDRGYLAITDRIKDMFTVGGFNVYPAEVEQTLVRMEPVLDCAVIGIPDERMGEVGLAFVVPRAGATVTAEDVIDYCRENLANYKVPRVVRVVSELPRNASGKVLKTSLREMAK